MKFPERQAKQVIGILRVRNHSRVDPDGTDTCNDGRSAFSCSLRVPYFG